MLDSAGEIKVASEVYRGSTEDTEHARGIKSCEFHWNREKYVGTFDHLLAKQLIFAVTEGRDGVNVLDVGSGDAALYKEFVRDPKKASESLLVLRNNPNLRVNFVGLTDSPSDDKNFSKTPIEVDAAFNGQISCWNENYSLTRTQTLAKFLEKEEIGDLDLVLSTWCLTYLGPGNFGQVVRDSINHLRSQTGYMVAAAYAEQEIPGFRRRDPSLGHDLDVRSKDDGSDLSLMKKALGGESIRFYDRDVDIGKEEKGVKLAEDFLLKKGVVDKDSLEEVRDEFQEEVNKQIRSKAGSLSMRSLQTTNQPIEKLARAKATKMKAAKQDVLRNLQLEFKDRADIEFGSSVITIKKT